MSPQGQHSFPQRRTYGPGFVTEAWGFHPGLKGEVMIGVIREWRLWLRSKRNKRIAEREEKKRLALMRQRDIRREKHLAFRHMDGMLMEATHRALAAECGREWG